MNIDKEHWTGSRIVGLQGQTPAPEKKPRRWLKRLLMGTLLLFLFLVLGLEGYGWYLGHRHGDEATAVAARDDKGKSVAPDKLAAANAKLQKRLAALAPKGQYVVIDTANNRVYLREGERNLREMLASCGSGNVLVDPVGGRTWTFDTPRGQFQVRSKVNKPVWIKPDWAFIEEGEPIPSRTSDRAEANVMGDYALGIGNGYFIHGTLYKRLLGRNVSHGCVRLGDEDLEFLFNVAKFGTKVIIF
ncbi:MAG: L,D-transpeptidase [Desulfuromonadales bacterium]